MTKRKYKKLLSRSGIGRPVSVSVSGLWYVFGSGSGSVYVSGSGSGSLFRSRSWSGRGSRSWSNL